MTKISGYPHKRTSGYSVIFAKSNKSSPYKKLLTILDINSRYRITFHYLALKIVYHSIYRFNCYLINR